MPFRAWNDQSFVGYGVSTKQINQTNANIEHSLIDILLNEDIPALFSDISPPNRFIRFAATIQWRAKLRIDAFDNLGLRKYNALSGKSQFGNYLVGAFDYVADEGFISYETFISEIYSLTLVFQRDSYEQEELPCDEPIADIDLLPLPEQALFPYTSTQSSTFNVGGFSVAGRPTSKIGDSFIAYMSPTVLGVTSGISYLCSMVPYRQRDLRDNNPIRILI